MSQRWHRASIVGSIRYYFEGSSVPVMVVLQVISKTHFSAVA